MRLRLTPLLIPLALALAAAAAAAEPAGEPAGESAGELVRRLEAHQASLGSLSASFTQTYRSAATGQELVEKGRIFVKRPYLRFDYRRPDKKVFLVEADGTTLAYVPADRSAVRSALAADAPHLRLLRGEMGLLEDFSARTVTLEEPLEPGSVQLKLVPRRPSAELDLVYLEVSPDARTLHRVLVLDALGNESDLHLQRVRENPALDDGDFRLQLPRGVSVRDLTTEAGR